VGPAKTETIFERNRGALLEGMRMSTVLQQPDSCASFNFSWTLVNIENGGYQGDIWRTPCRRYGFDFFSFEGPVPEGGPLERKFDNRQDEGG
jgi:hypothetical protein